MASQARNLARKIDLSAFIFSPRTFGVSLETAAAVVVARAVAVAVVDAAAVVVVAEQRDGGQLRPDSPPLLPLQQLPRELLRDALERKLFALGCFHLRKENVRDIP